MALSYSQGLGTTPLLGETIGGELRPRRRHLPRARRARRAPPGRAAELRRAGRGRRPRRRARSPRSGWARATALGIWAPNCAEWVRDAVRDREARRDPRQRQPRLPHHRARLRAAPVGLQGAGLRDRVQDLRLPGDGRRGPRRPARPRARPLHRREACFDDAPGEVEWPELDSVRADQHPVHERHHGLAQGRHALALQHPQQRLLRGRVLRLHGGGPRLHPGALLPLLRHGHGQPRRASPTAPAWSSRRPSFEPEATLAAVAEERCTSLYGVPTMFIAELEHPELRRPSTCPRCGPGSWPARRAPSRSCARSSTACTWRA